MKRALDMNFDECSFFDDDFRPRNLPIDSDHLSLRLSVDEKEFFKLVEWIPFVSIFVVNVVHAAVDSFLDNVKSASCRVPFDRDVSQSSIRVTPPFSIILSSPSTRESMLDVPKILAHAVSTSFETWLVVVADDFGLNKRQEK